MAENENKPGGRRTTRLSVVLAVWAAVLFVVYGGLWGILWIARRTIILD
jgi:hypothetical protein